MSKKGYLDGSRDGRHLQHAARQRPDLVVRRQQLPDGQGALPVRPAVLERRRDAHAGGDAHLLPAQHVPEEPAGAAGRARASTTCRSTCARSRSRSTCSPARKTTSRPPSRSTRRRSSSPARCASCWRARATSPASSIRRAAKKYQHWLNETAKNPPTLDEWQAGATEYPRLVVERLGQVAVGEVRRQGPGARARRAAACPRSRMRRAAT